MTRSLALVVALWAAAPAAAADDEGPLLINGTPYDAAARYPLPKDELGRLVYFASGGYRYRADAGPDAKVRSDVQGDDRDSAFMQKGGVLQRKTVGDIEYVLITETDQTRTQARKPFGWVPAAFVIDSERARALSVRVYDPETATYVRSRIRRKGMIINSIKTVTEDLKRRRDGLAEPLFTVARADVAPDLDKGTCPPAVLKAFADSGLKVAGEAKVTRRADNRGWSVSFREVTDGASAAQQYDLLVGAKADQVEAHAGLNMAWVYARPLTKPERDGKAERALRRKSFTTSNVFFIYRELAGYCLIGSKPEAAGGQLIHGWVESDRLSMWDTTATFEWDYESTLPADKRIQAPGPAERRPPAGALFHDEKIAQQWMTAFNAYVNDSDADGKARADRLRTAAEDGAPVPIPEPTDPDDRTSGRRLGGMEMRYPILRTRGKNKDNQYPLHELGWFGPVKFGNGREVSAAKYDEHRQKVMNSVREMKTVELLFVIDGTGSMEEQRTKVVPKVMTACLRDLDKLRREKGGKGDAGTFAELRVRVTVALFGRDKNQKLTVVYSPLSNNQNGLANEAEIISAQVGDQAEARITGLEKWVKDAPVLGASEDAKEPVFDAVLQAISKANFTATATKYVFLMADMGDESGTAEVRGNMRKMIDSLVSVKRTADGDKAGDPQPKNFFAVQLKSIAGGVTPNAKLLTDQLTALQRELRQSKVLGIDGQPQPSGVEAAFEAADYKDETELPEAIRKNFTASFERLRARVVKLEADAIGASIGTIQKDAIDPASLRHWEANGVDLTVLAAGGVQVYQPMYAFRDVPAAGPVPQGKIRPKQTQLRTVYLITAYDAGELLKSLRAIVGEKGELSRNPKDLRERLEGVLVALLKADEKAYGDEDLTPEEREQRKNETEEQRNARQRKQAQKYSLQDYFYLSTGIKFNSPLLQRRPDQLNDPLTNEEVEKVLKACKRLENMLADEEGVLEVQDLGQGELLVKTKKGTTRPADRIYLFAGDNTQKWVWLDGEHHLP